MCLDYLRQSAAHSKSLTVNYGLINKDFKHVDLVKPDVPLRRLHYSGNCGLYLCHPLICIDCYGVYPSDIGANFILIRLVVLIERGLEAFALISYRSEDSSSMLIYFHFNYILLT